MTVRADSPVKSALRIPLDGFSGRATSLCSARRPGGAGMIVGRTRQPVPARTEKASPRPRRPCESMARDHGEHRRISPRNLTFSRPAQSTHRARRIKVPLSRQRDHDVAGSGRPLSIRPPAALDNASPAETEWHAFTSLPFRFPRDRNTGSHFTGSALRPSCGSYRIYGNGTGNDNSPPPFFPSGPRRRKARSGGRPPDALRRLTEAAPGRCSYRRPRRGIRPFGTWTPVRAHGIRCTRPLVTVLAIYGWNPVFTGWGRSRSEPPLLRIAQMERS